MRLTRAGEYAVRCVLHLSSQGQGTLCARKDVAERMDIPDQFLGKIAQQLARAGVIDIVQGAKGGLRLVVAPDRVTLLEVVEAVIGEIFLNDCVLRPESCAAATRAPCTASGPKPRTSCGAPWEKPPSPACWKKTIARRARRAAAPRARRRATRRTKGVD